MLVRRWCN